MLSPTMFSLVLVLIGFFCQPELALCQIIPLPEIKNCLQPADHCVGTYFVAGPEPPPAPCKPADDTDCEYVPSESEESDDDDLFIKRPNSDSEAVGPSGRKRRAIWSSSEAKITSVKRRRSRSVKNGGVKRREGRIGPSRTKRNVEPAKNSPNPNRDRRSSDDASGKGKCDIPSRLPKSDQGLEGGVWVTPCFIDYDNKDTRSAGMFSHKAKIGDSCDPLLFQAYRRLYDDSRDISEVLTNETDSGYRGACRFLCPDMMCMSVGKGQWGSFYVDYEMDMVELDCVTAEDGPPNNKGVCTCGNLMGRVDPSNNVSKKYITKSVEVGGEGFEFSVITYDAVYGLDRRLVWNETNQVCAADHFGHCSLDMEGFEHTNKTGCHYATDSCVNETVFDNNLAYLPVRTEVGGRWFGVCAVKKKDTNPWARASRLGGSVCPTLIFTVGLAALAAQLLR